MRTVPSPQAVAGVQNAIAAYAHALDDGRTDDVVAQFTARGVSEIVGYGTFEGHAALQEGYSGLVPAKPQRHLVTNTAIVSISPDEVVATSDLVWLVRDEKGWIVEGTGRYQDTLRNEDGVWRFAHRTLRFTV
ncbi:nuclear transport factor 2 family protein [Nocardia carnea]|uniref:nuclear transport factor 2 family protein n=1 Tax=Nocardia carnea TaxID=37328 RepID=UPI002457A025|nr:nuclear transport factor 2 family protein [Nocardia carnea]